MGSAFRPFFFSLACLPACLPACRLSESSVVFLTRSSALCSFLLIVLPFAHLHFFLWARTHHRRHGQFTRLSVQVSRGRRDRRRQELRHPALRARCLQYALQSNHWC